MTSVIMRLTRQQYEKVVVMMYDEGPQCLTIENKFSVAYIPRCVLASVRQRSADSY